MKFYWSVVYTIVKLQILFYISIRKRNIVMTQTDQSYQQIYFLYTCTWLVVKTNCMAKMKKSFVIKSLIYNVVTDFSHVFITVFCCKFSKSILLNSRFLFFYFFLIIFHDVIFLFFLMCCIFPWCQISIV